VQISARRPTPGELDYELIWLSASLGSLGLAAGWFSLHLPWPICLFHAVTGHPCVTCGATRSATQFFHGHFLSALWWNPLVFLSLCGLSIFNAYAFVVLITGAPRLRVGQLTIAEKQFVRTAVVALLAVNWVYLLIVNSGI